MENSFTPDELLKADADAADLCLVAASFEHVSNSMYEMGKDLLAAIMNKVEAQQENVFDKKSKIPTTELERLARGSKEWTDFRKGLYEAQEKASIASVKAKSAIRHFDCLQSCLSYRKEEFKRLGSI